MYLTGKGVSRDFGKASALFEQAADGGDVWGANNLGGLYEMGWGVEADQQKALAYYSQASEKGNKHAGENFRRLSAVLGSSAIGPRVEQSNASDPAVLTKAKVGSAPRQSNAQAS